MRVGEREGVCGRARKKVFDGKTQQRIKTDIQQKCFEKRTRKKGGKRGKRQRSEM